MLLGNRERNRDGYSIRSGTVGLAKMRRSGSIQPIYADAKIECLPSLQA